MPKESLEFPGSVEGTVKFSKETCCALSLGFDRNPSVVGQLIDMIGDYKVKLFREILTDTDEMKFVPSEEMKTVYVQVAKVELRKIDDDSDLSCNHSVAEHRKALDLVTKKMQTAVN